MKKNIESKKIISVLLIILLLFTTKVYAVNDSFSTTIKVSESQAKREDIITITIGLKDIAIESGEKGIGAYTASIEFDHSVLEYVSTNGTDKWEAPFYQDGLITGNTKDGKVVNNVQNIGTVTFKVKSDAKLGETSIELKNFSGSTAASDVYTSNIATKLTILDENGNNNTNNSNNNQNNDKDNSNSNNTNNNNANNNNSSSNNKNEQNNGNNTSNNNVNSNKEPSTSNVIDITMKQGTLPKTGTSDIAIFIMIVISIVVATIFFIKMRLI